MVTVSEISHYLPLSQRPPHDESAVTNNWAPAMATVLHQLAIILSPLAATDWEIVSARVSSRSHTVTVRTIVGELLWSMHGTRRSRFIAIVRCMATQRRLPAQATAHLVSVIALRETTNLLSELTSLAATNGTAHASGGITGSIRQLGAGVAALFEICAVTGRTVAVDPLISGAVAIAKSLSAPLPITAVLRQCRITARENDASATTTGTETETKTADGWSVGRGRQSDATASAIVLFLYGRRGFPTPTSG